MTRSHSS